MLYYLWLYKIFNKMEKLSPPGRGWNSFLTFKGKTEEEEESKGCFCCKLHRDPPGIVLLLLFLFLLFFLFMQLIPQFTPLAKPSLLATVLSSTPTHFILADGTFRKISATVLLCVKFFINSCSLLWPLQRGIMCTRCWFLLVWRWCG